MLRKLLDRGTTNTSSRLVSFCYGLLVVHLRTGLTRSLLHMRVDGSGNKNRRWKAGVQKDSRRATSARAMIGTGIRDPHNDFGKATPGPVYAHRSGIGKQLLSTKPNPRSVGFGTATRFRSTISHPIHGTPGAGQYGSNHPGAFAALGTRAYHIYTVAQWSRHALRS